MPAHLFISFDYPWVERETARSLQNSMLVTFGMFITNLSLILSNLQAIYIY